MTPTATASKELQPFLKTAKLARGSIASLGIGGKTVSTSIAMKMPDYPYVITNEVTYLQFLLQGMMMTKK